MGRHLQPFAKRWERVASNFSGRLGHFLVVFAQLVKGLAKSARFRIFYKKLWFAEKWREKSCCATVYSALYWLPHATKKVGRDPNLRSIYEELVVSEFSCVVV